MTENFHCKLKSPLGILTLVANAKSLKGILWENDSGSMKSLSLGTLTKDHDILIETRNQLLSYFEGKLRRFNLPIEFDGTEFQKKVWGELLTIPFGETRTYSDLAKNIGAPRACRAVGMSNSRNPISIVVPCHRVIGANGTLTGFAGGLAAKRYLLELEESRLN